MQSYHGALSRASGTLANYAPCSYTRPHTVDLVMVELCRYPVGTLIEDAVRAIARRIGRSAGSITPALKRLAADGWISYLADGRGMLIEILRSLCDHDS